MGEELLGPVQFLIGIFKPLMTWTGVTSAWLQGAALNVIVLTTFIAKTFAWKGWKIMLVAGGWGVLYALAEYLPSVVAVIGGAVLCFVMTALALKVAGLVGLGANKVMKPLGAGDRRVDQ
jgi:hypothetical protein